MTIDLIEMGKAAKAAARKIAVLDAPGKTAALEKIADALAAALDEVLAANAADVAAGKAAGLSDAILDRLLLTPERVANLVADIRKVAALPDPVGRESESRLLDNGIRLVKRQVPIGVLAVIYEARPNVTIDIAALSLKSGNAVILRGGKETIASNKALAKVIQRGLSQAGLPAAAVQLIDDPDRALVRQLLRLDQYVDMLIPRGGAGLHRLCKDESSIPVITGGIGICHIFVDESADLVQAVDIVENAKVQRPSVCNALDTILIHHQVAKRFLPLVAERLAQSGVELRATKEAATLLGKNCPAKVVIAGVDDFDQEWLSLVLGIKIVDGLAEAIDHIAAHSTEHSDSILTSDWENAGRFVNEVNSAAVYVNASTRFTDGGQFGLGAEVAVSTQKLHARGPMGPAELTTYKWIGYGNGQIRK